jgi:hypothetical protein
MLGWLVLKVVLVKEFPLPETNMVHPNSKLCIWGLGACSLEFIHNIAWVSDVSKLQMNQTDQENMHRIVICREFPAQMKSTIRKLTYIFFAPHHDESAKGRTTVARKYCFHDQFLSTGCSGSHVPTLACLMVFSVLARKVGGKSTRTVFWIIYKLFAANTTSICTRCASKLSCSM